MSQMSRATRPPSSSYGRTRNVSRSGFSTMSDSSIRTNPSIDEPSNMMSPSSAFSNWLSGTSTFLLIPRISVNWSRRKLIPCFLQTWRMSRLEAAVAFGAVAMLDDNSRRQKAAKAATGLSSPRYRPCRPCRPRSDVVVQEELVRMRPQRHGIDFLDALVGDPRLDQVGREHPALKQESVVRLERRERLVQGARRVLHMLALLGLEVVQVYIHRLRRLDLVLDAVQARHEQRRERQVRIARRIGGPELHAFRLGRLGIHRDATDRRPVTLRIDQVDRGLVA